MLLSADSAVVGSWFDGVLDKHKCFTGYTVRRSSGTSQLTHMRKYGLTFHPCALHGMSSNAAEIGTCRTLLQ